MISDLQIPFEHERALKFCKYLQKHYKISKENILCVGDETDCYFGSQYNKSIDADLSATRELEITRKKIRRWGIEFPKMRIAISNHGTRWVKKALESEIPSQLLRSYKEVISAPEGWQWRYEWRIKGAKENFIMKHGMEYGGQYPFKTAPLVEGCNVVFGHLHSSAGIAHVKTSGFRAWGMNVGSLIDESSFAFEYGKMNKFKPNLGCGIILDGGSRPVWHPIESF